MLLEIAFIPLEKRMSCFIALGKEIKNLSAEERLLLCRKAVYENAWFTESNVIFALESLSKMLEEENLVDFVLSYPDLSEKRNCSNFLSLGYCWIARYWKF